jgi:hypothetical protein
LRFPLRDSTLFLATTTIIVRTGWSLQAQNGNAFSLSRLVVVLLAMPVMHFVVCRKLAPGRAGEAKTGESGVWNGRKLTNRLTNE